MERRHGCSKMQGANTLVLYHRLSSILAFLLRGGASECELSASEHSFSSSVPGTGGCVPLWSSIQVPSEISRFQGYLLSGVKGPLHCRPRQLLPETEAVLLNDASIAPEELQILIIRTLLRLMLAKQWKTNTSHRKRDQVIKVSGGQPCCSVK